MVYTDYDSRDTSYDSKVTDSNSPFYGVTYVITIKKENMNNLIYIGSFYPYSYDIVFTNEARAIDEGHIYYMLFDSTQYGLDYISYANIGLNKICDENGVEITEITNSFYKHGIFAGYKYLYSVIKTNGVYNVQLISTTDYHALTDAPNLYSDSFNGTPTSQLHMRNNNSVGTENSLVIGTHNLTNYSSVEGNKVS